VSCTGAGDDPGPQPYRCGRCPISKKQKPSLNTLFEYVFDHQMKPTKVKIHMKHATSGDTCWMFVKRA